MFCRLGSVEDSRPVGGHRLVIGGVHAAGARDRSAPAACRCRWTELGEAAVVEHDPRQRVVCGELFQHVLGGGGLPGRGLAQHRQAAACSNRICCSCFGDSMLNRAPASRCACSTELLQLHARTRALCARSMLAIDSTPWRSMRSQHRHQRLLDLLVQRAPAPARCSSFGHSARCSRSVTSASSAAYSRCALHRHLVEADLLGAFAGDILEGDGPDARDNSGRRNPCRAAWPRCSRHRTRAWCHNACRPGGYHDSAARGRRT